MYKTSFRVSLLVIFLMLPWTVVYAAGLGKLTLNSALGQPLSAVIDIVTTNRDEASSLKARIATRETFAQEGINYESSFSTFKISIEPGANGNPYIKLTSPQAVNDPFLNILVELNWDSGRILREYAVLLDPVEVKAQAIAAPDVDSVPAIIATRKESDIRKDRQDKSPPQSAHRSASQGRDTYGPVNRGDTLSSIARQVLPAGIDLNQMLVALYRANRDAFIANNMNLLKVGAVLKIPEKNEAGTIDASAASAEIRMQVADWHNYQGKIAATSSESSAHADIRQSDQGKITMSIDKKCAVTREEPPKEVLRLSSGASLTDKDGQSSESALADRLRMMEEDAIARNLALQEANQRVAMLEKSIENLKQLLELKDSVLAQTQIKGAIPNTETKPKTQSTEEVINFPPDNGSRLNTDSLQAQEQEAPITQLANEAALKDTEAKPLPVQETENQSLTDQIFDNIEYIGAALISLLLVALLILRRRRNQLNGELDADERNAKFSSAIQSKMAAMAATQTVPVTEASHSFSGNERDDLTYENIHAYPETGRYDENFDEGSLYYEEDSEQIKKSGLETESVSGLPDEREGLVDGSRLNDQTLDLNPGKDFEESDNRSVDSTRNHDAADFTNAIDFDLTDEANGIDQDLAIEHVDDIKEGIELSENPANLQKTVNASDYESRVDSDDARYSLDSSNFESMAVEKDDTIEFTHSAIDLTTEEPFNEVKMPGINAESQSTGHDFDASGSMHKILDSEQRQEVVENTPESVPDMPELEFADISLDIEDSNSTDKISEVSDFNDKDEQWQEIETKLDLAKAYQEMDDKEGAKEMLEEVLRDGDEKQRKTARGLLKNLS